MSAPITMRIRGVMRLFSNEYLTRKTTPRKKTKPPIQAKSLTPMNASQSMARRSGLGTDGVGLVRGTAATGGAAAGCAIVVGNGGGVARGIGIGAGAVSFGAIVAAVAGAIGWPLSSALSRSLNFFTVASSARTRLAFVMERRIGAMSAINASRTRKAINPSI